MPEIALVNVGKHTCRNLHLTIEDGEYFVLVGATGAGKTTLLNIIAGLVDHDGTVYLDKIDVNRLPPSARGVGYLFQEPALFPNLSVTANITFGLRAQGYAQQAVHERATGLMDMLRIGHLADRYPHTLSGGESKRVALARSLAPSPKILLLDEPTANVDPQTARHLRGELHTLLKKLRITTVHVTHDLQEAEELADRIAFIANGSIQQVATPADFFFNPANASVVEFIGTPTLLECETTTTLASGLVEVVAGELKIIVPYTGNRIQKIAIPPDAITFCAAPPRGPMLNHFVGRVDDITHSNGSVRIRVLVGNDALFSEISESIFANMGIDKGMEVHGGIKINRLRYVGW